MVITMMYSTNMCHEFVTLIRFMNDDDDDSDADDKV